MAAPATPANLSIDTTASNGFELTWDNVALETGFYLYRSTDNFVADSRRVAKLATDVLTAFDLGLIASTQYYYKISAFNGDGESAFSAAVNDTTLAQSLKQHWQGTVGPFDYDQNAIYPGENTKVVGLRSTGNIRADLVPSIDNHMVRKIDILGSAINSPLIEDADQDTKVQCEESNDEDKIRFDIGGVGGGEKAVMDANAFEIKQPVTVNGITKMGDGGVTNYTKIVTDGEITLFGTARVIDVIDVEPDAVRRPVANPPGESLEDGFPCHDYNDTTDESVFKHVELTHGYAAAGLIHIHLDYFVDVGPVDGTVDNLSWGLEYKKISIGDVFTFASGTTLVYAADVVTQGNNKKIHQSDPLSLTTTGFVAGDIVLMRIFRDASGTGNTDNVSGDIRVFDYHIEFLVDKLGEAT